MASTALVCRPTPKLHGQTVAYLSRASNVLVRFARVYAEHNCDFHSLVEFRLRLQHVSVPSRQIPRRLHGHKKTVPWLPLLTQRRPHELRELSKQMLCLTNTGLMMMLRKLRESLAGHTWRRGKTKKTTKQPKKIATYAFPGEVTFLKKTT